jgi:hypothetical protein
MKKTAITKEFKSFDNELNTFVSKLTKRIETLIEERGINHLHLDWKHEIVITDRDCIKSISADGCDWEDNNGWTGSFTFEDLFMVSPEACLSVLQILESEDLESIGDNKDESYNAYAENEDDED